MSQYLSQIHPVNAQYLIKTEPYRVYADSERNIYEIMISRTRDNVNAIFAYYYHHAKSEGEENVMNSTLLSPSGEFSSLDGTRMREEIDIDIYYMALNPVNINGWYYQKKYSKQLVPSEMLGALSLKVK